MKVFSYFPVHFKRKLKFLILFSEGEEGFGLMTLNLLHLEVNLSHSSDVIWLASIKKLERSMVRNCSRRANEIKSCTYTVFRHSYYLDLAW